MHRTMLTHTQYSMYEYSVKLIFSQFLTPQYLAGDNVTLTWDCSSIDWGQSKHQILTCRTRSFLISINLTESSSQGLNYNSLWRQTPSQVSEFIHSYMWYSVRMSTFHYAKNEITSLPTVIRIHFELAAGNVHECEILRSNKFSSICLWH